MHEGCVRPRGFASSFWVTVTAGFFGHSHTMLRQSFIDELNSVPEMTWKAAMPGRFVGMPIGASKDMYVPDAIGESFGPAVVVNCTGGSGCRRCMLLVWLLAREETTASEPKSRSVRSVIWVVLGAA